MVVIPNYINSSPHVAIAIYIAYLHHNPMALVLSVYIAIQVDWLHDGLMQWLASVLEQCVTGKP